MNVSSASATSAAKALNISTSKELRTTLFIAFPP
jgi:hypothetical protein